MSASVYLPQRCAEVGPLPVPSTGDAEFPYNVDFANDRKCSNSLNTVVLRTLCSFIPTGMLAQIMQLFISIVFISYPGLSLVC